MRGRCVCCAIVFVVCVCGPLCCAVLCVVRWCARCAKLCCALCGVVGSGCVVVWLCGVRVYVWCTLCCAIALLWLVACAQHRGVCVLC